MLFKSCSKGLTSGSERIPVGFGKVELRNALSALTDEMLGESTIVGEATMITWPGQRCGYGLIPDRQRLRPTIFQPQHRSQK